MLRTLLFFISIGLSQTLFAQVTIGYSYLASPATTDISGVDASCISSAASLSRGSGITSNSGSTFNSRSWDAGTLSEAEDDNEFIEIDLVVPLGALDISSIQFRLDRSGNGPQNFEMQYSTNGFASSSTITSGTIAPSGSNFLVNSGLPTNITGTLTIRIFAWGASQSQGTMDVEQLGSTGFGIIIDGTVSGSCVMPVVFGGLEGRLDSDHQVQLAWDTYHEDALMGFDIEVMDYGNNWNSVGFVKSQGGSSEQHYTFLFFMSRSITGPILCRIRGIDLDGSAEYSEIISLDIPPHNQLLSWQEGDQLVVKFDRDINQQISYQLINLAGGSTLASGIIGSDQEKRVTVDVSDLRTGIYAIQAQFGTQTRHVKIYLHSN